MSHEIDATMPASDAMMEAAFRYGGQDGLDYMRTEEDARKAPQQTTVELELLRENCDE